MKRTIKRGCLYFSGPGTVGICCQQRAARWTTCHFDRTASVLDMIVTLGRRTLEQRRVEALLCIFFKIVNIMVVVPIPDYIQPNPRTDRRGHSRIFCQLLTAKDYYMYSCFPLAIVQWNALPEDVVSSLSIDILASCNIQSLKPSLDGMFLDVWQKRIYGKGARICFFSVYTICRKHICSVCFITNFVCLFVCVEVERPSQQFFSHVGTEPPLSGYYQYFQGVKCLAQGNL